MLLRYICLIPSLSMINENYKIYRSNEESILIKGYRHNETDRSCISHILSVLSLLRIFHCLPFSSFSMSSMLGRVLLKSAG